jgi:multisubunit Na+/H+ antiporter MnhG subunit
MILAATIMLLIGLFQVLMGVVGIVRQAFYAHPSAYPYAFNARSWGWINVILGAILLVTALGLYASVTWARVVGIAVVVVAAVGNFMFLPYYPLWSLVLLGLDAFVIWALIRGDTGGRAETWRGD